MGKEVIKLQKFLQDKDEQLRSSTSSTEQSILESVTHGTKLVEVSNEDSMVHLTFNEDLDARPWWMPTSNINFLSEPFDESSTPASYRPKMHTNPLESVPKLSSLLYPKNPRRRILKRLVHRRRGAEREHALGDSWFSGTGRADALGGAGRLDAGARVRRRLDEGARARRRLERRLGSAWLGARSLAPGEAARHRLVERTLVGAWRRRSDARLGLEKRRGLL